MLFMGMLGSTDASSRFHQYFQHSKSLFADVSRHACNATLQAYEAEYNRSSNHAWIDLGVQVDRPIYNLCRDQSSCILEHTSEANKASLSTAGVVLGLLPTLLAVLSPSISELALLSAHRPLLAALISLGSPGVIQTRIFAYEDPAELLDMSNIARKTGKSQLALGPWSRGVSVAVSTMQYALALACVVNTVHMASQLSDHAVISWGCTRTWPMFVWVFVPMVIHGLAALGYRFTLERSTPSISEGVKIANTFFTRVLAADNDRKEPQAQHLVLGQPGEESTHIQSLGRSASRSGRFRREWLPSAAHIDAIWLRLPCENPSGRVSIGILLSCIAGFLSFFHLLYGTVAFSGLLFVDALDAISQVMLRFLASSMLCRFIVLVEIAGMRGAVLTVAKGH